MKKVILASGSPRRKALLEQAGIEYEIDVSDADETVYEDCTPSEYVEILSYRKAAAVAERCPDDIILGADTVVVYKGKILGKPEDEEDAFRMLSMLSGKVHEVYTGVTILCGGEGTRDSFHVRTGVAMYENAPELLWEYIKSGEPMDKAGAYGIQGKGAILVKEIQGDYYNVMGLPIAEVFRHLARLRS